MEPRPGRLHEGESVVVDEAAALAVHAARVAELAAALVAELAAELAVGRVAALQRPGAWPDGAMPVQVIETHLSSLLLAGDRVYKLKKPRRLDFVDFSTLAAREAACREELRLNRRTAPAVYRAVLPVVQTPAGPRIVPFDPDGPAEAAEAAEAAQPIGAAQPAPPGPVVDWALAMARFDETQGFDRLAARGALTAAQVEALARAIVQFHAPLPPAPPGFGAPDQVRDWACRNTAELAGLVAGDPTLAARVDALARWSDARGAALAGAMAARLAAGQVREGHGDLHLGNVVWHGGAPLLFDALEFNPGLRHLDVVGDWAFTAMDLLARAGAAVQDSAPVGGDVGAGTDTRAWDGADTGADLAWRFVSTVVEASGDQGALALLPWWGVYRALVRAKVARLGPPGPAADAAFARYLRTAEALAALQPLTRPRPAPWLVLTGGLSGSGKSAVAQGLLGRLGAVRLRSDVERKRLFGLAPEDRPPSALGLYNLAANRRTYDRLLALAEAALAAGIGVVVDAASLRRAERAAFADLARRQGARHVLLWCEAPEAVLRARLQARAAAGTDPSDATVDVLARQQQFAEWPQPDEAAPLFRLDTDAPADTVLQRALALPWAAIGPAGSGGAPG